MSWSINKKGPDLNYTKKKRVLKNLWTSLMNSIELITQRRISFTIFQRFVYKEFLSVRLRDVKFSMEFIKDEILLAFFY